MFLAIDTCGSSGTIALARRDGSGLVGLGSAELAGKTYSAMIVIRIGELLERHGVKLSQLEGIVVVNGPGSFTGVRVGVSAAKGIAEALSMPVLAVSRLKVLAWKAGLPCAALDAGRGEFYFGDYREAATETLASSEEVRSSVAISELAVCDEKSTLAFPEARFVELPGASEALEVALPRLLASDFDDLAALDGNYLRRSDAELFAWKKNGAAAGNQTA